MTDLSQIWTILILYLRQITVAKRDTDIVFKVWTKSETMLKVGTEINYYFWKLKNKCLALDQSSRCIKIAFIAANRSVKIFSECAEDRYHNVKSSLQLQDQHTSGKHQVL